MKVFFIELPKILLINLFRSNLVTEVSFKVKVVWQAVNLLNNSALFEMLLPKPELEIIFIPSKKYSNDKGPDW